MPKAFVVEVKIASDDKVIMVHQNLEGFKKSNTGKYNSEILCHTCDGLLGNYENYVYTILKGVREDAHAQQALPDQTAKIGSIDGDKFVRFAAGLCWKYSVSKRQLHRIQPGPYVEVLAQAAFGTDTIPSSLDVMAFHMLTGDGEVYFYREPIPDRKDGVNFFRFCVGGFVFLLKVDKRPCPNIAEPKFWLRGNHVAYFPIVSALDVDDWKSHAQIVEQNDPLKKYTQTYIERKNLDK